VVRNPRVEPRGSSGRLRRAVAGLALLVLIGGGALAFGQVTGTFAIFTTETENPNAVFQGSWVPPIQSQSSSLVNSGSYNQVQLSWSLGTIPSSGNPITGYSLEYGDGGSSGSATCSGYGSFSTPSGSPVQVTGTNISDWWCFRIHATTATVWTSATVAFTPQRLFVPVGTVVFTNHAVSGFAFDSDTIAITFNQAPSNPGNITVQFCTSGVIQIGSSACATAGSVGTITGLTINNNASFSATEAASGSTLTITLSSFALTQVSDTGSYTPGGSMTSSGGQQACTVTGTCSVATSGSF
jgi:hypothetical protein